MNKSSKKIKTKIKLKLKINKSNKKTNTKIKTKQIEPIILHNKNRKKFGFNRLKSIKKTRKFGSDIGIGIGADTDRTKETKSFLDSISDFITNSNSTVQDQDQKYANTVQDIKEYKGPEYDEILKEKFVRDPISVIPYHTTTSKTAIVIIGPQNMYIRSDSNQELLIKIIDLLSLAKDRITDIYNILFSTDIVENGTKIYSGTNFLVPNLLINSEKEWASISNKDPTYIMVDNHFFKQNQILSKFYSDLLNNDKVIIVSFLEPEQELFIKELVYTMDTIKRKLTWMKNPKIVVIKDLDTDLIQQGLDTRIKTVSVLRALDDDYWTADNIISTARRNWTDPIEKNRYADPEITEYNKTEARSVINKRARLHSGPVFSFKNNLPINPVYKDYMFSGRGSLPYYGPNFETYIIPRRKNNYDGLGNPIIEILVRTIGNYYDLIYYMDSIDIILNFIYKKLNLSLEQDSSKLLFEGQLINDPRMTKNAWVEAAVYTWDLTNSHREMRLDKINYEWVSIDNIQNLINFDGRKEILEAIESIKQINK